MRPPLPIFAMNRARREADSPMHTPKSRYCFKMKPTCCPAPADLCRRMTNSNRRIAREADLVIVAGVAAAGSTMIADLKAEQKKSVIERALQKNRDLSPTMNSSMLS